MDLVATLSALVADAEAICQRDETPEDVKALLLRYGAAVVGLSQMLAQAQQAAADKPRIVVA